MIFFSNGGIMEFKLVRESTYKQNQIFEYQHNSGAKLIHISNQDSHRSFCLQFRTPAIDNTGVTHIIEHCVLAGSKKFKVKEPFVEILKSSLNTMTNAMTFLDKTAYVLSSTNEKDLLNSIEVYLDGLFCPAFYDDPLIFMREGWHYEIENDKLEVSGVVYNEMKGAMSDPVRVLFDQVYSCAFNNNYQYNSGGNPEDILKLTYNEFLDYHRKYYRPDNCVIAVYGDLDINKIMELCVPYFSVKSDDQKIEDVCLSQGIVSSFKKQSYAVSNSKETGYLWALGYKFGDCYNLEQLMAIQILENMLFNMEMSPIHKRLNGLVGELFASYDVDKEGLFTIGAIGVKEEDIPVIKEKLNAFIQEMSLSLDADFLLAALNKFRFHLLNGGNASEGLNMCLDVTKDYDRGVLPDLVLDKETILNDLASRDIAYFKDLIKDLFVNNLNQVEVILVPDCELASANQEKLSASLDKMYRSLSQDEINEIKLKQKQLLLAQQQQDSVEDLAKIPRLSLSDIKPREHSYSYVKDIVNGYNRYMINYDHHGINYYRLVFDISHLDYQKLPLLSLLLEVFKFLDTKHYGNEQYLVEINKYVGSLTLSPLITQRGKYLVAGLAYLDNSQKAFELLFEQLFNYILADDNWADIKQALSSYCANFELSLSGRGGVNLASSRVHAYYDSVEAHKQYLSGYDCYIVLKNYLDQGDDFIKNELINQLRSLYSNLFGLNNFEVYYQGVDFSDKLWDFINAYLANFIDNRTVVDEAIVFESHKEGFVVGSDVNYVACGCVLDDFSGVDVLAKQLLNTDYLWQKVRLEQGAYGCWSIFSRRDKFVTFVSYRDPGIESTLDVFDKISEYLMNLKDVDLDKYKIGCLSQLNYPLAKSQMLARLLGDILNDDSEEDRDILERQILDADIDMLISRAHQFIKMRNRDYVCVVGGKQLESLDFDVKRV